MYKLKVYLNEYNILMDNTIFLPLACGLLQAYAQTKPEIQKNYQFMPFLFLRDDPNQILSQYENPAVAAFSASIWNINFSLAIAQRVKEKFPNCLTVFGGPQVPLEPLDFLHTYPFIDVTVHGEGEYTFAELLIRLLEARDFGNILGICWRNGKTWKRNEDRPKEEHLDVFPSPYLEETFNYLLTIGMNWQAVVEATRGCPFKCSFCFWGQGSQLRFFSLERVKKIAEWCGTNKIKYVFCADANFGMLKRDLEIVNYFVAAKAQYGFPDKFRACCGKNAEENIFKIGKLLTQHDMEKGISLSRQSNSPQTLANIGRKNIKLEVYSSLQKKYDRENIPTFTELVLGLPGETYESFLQGIEEILEEGTRNQIYVYICQVYPNTELGTKEYQQRFGIKTVTIPLNPLHSSAHREKVPREYEEIVISTASMPVEDWKRAIVVSWIMQLLHSLKLGVYILDYLKVCYQIKYTDFFEHIALLKLGGIMGDEVTKFHLLADSILEGKPYRYIAPGFGSLYWEPEEVCHLNLSSKREAFYEEVYLICKDYLGSLGKDYDANELRNVIDHQKACVPICKGDKETFAREVLLYGRKSGRL